MKNAPPFLAAWRGLTQDFQQLLADGVVRVEVEHTKECLLERERTGAVRSLESSVADLQAANELSSARAAVASLEEAVSSREAQLQFLKDNRSRSQSDLEAAAAELREQLVDMALECELEIKNAEKELRGERARAGQVQNRLADAQYHAAKETHRFAALEQELTEAHALSGTLTSKLSEAALRGDALERALTAERSMSSELRAAAAESARLREADACRDAQTGAQAREAESEEASSRLAAMQRELTAARAELNGVRTELEGARAEVLEATAKAAEANEELASLAAATAHHHHSSPSSFVMTSQTLLPAHGADGHNPVPVRKVGAEGPAPSEWLPEWRESEVPAADSAAAGGPAPAPAPSACSPEWREVDGAAADGPAPSAWNAGMEPAWREADGAAAEGAAASLAGGAAASFRRRLAGAHKAAASRDAAAERAERAVSSATEAASEAELLSGRCSSVEATSSEEAGGDAEEAKGVDAGGARRAGWAGHRSLATSQPNGTRGAGSLLAGVSSALCVAACAAALAAALFATSPGVSVGTTVSALLGSKADPSEQLSEAGAEPGRSRNAQNDAGGADVLSADLGRTETEDALLGERGDAGGRGRGNASALNASALASSRGPRSLKGQWLSEISAQKSDAVEEVEGAERTPPGGEGRGGGWLSLGWMRGRKGGAATH
ncbi:hypothetical protein T484DRAFT_1766093, partial [Baffinella frigidus]